MFFNYIKKIIIVYFHYFKYNLKNKKFKCLKWNSKQEFIIK